MHREKQSYKENKANSLCKYNMSMNKDKHISVKGNSKKEQRKLCFCSRCSWFNTYFPARRVQPLYLQHREKKDCERRGMQPLPTKTKHPCMVFLTIPRNMFRGRYNCLQNIHITQVQLCRALYGFQAKPRIVSQSFPFNKACNFAQYAVSSSGCHLYFRPRAVSVIFRLVRHALSNLNSTIQLSLGFQPSTVKRPYFDTLFSEDSVFL